MVRGDRQFREATAVEARAYLGSAGIQHRRVFVDSNRLLDLPRLQNCIDSDALTDIECDAGLCKLLEACRFDRYFIWSGWNVCEAVKAR